MALSPIRLRLLHGGNLFFMAAALVLSLGVNLNGCIFGLPELPSLVLTILVFSFGSVAAGAVIFLEPRRPFKLAGAAALAFYSVLLFPALMP